VASDEANVEDQPEPDAPHRGTGRAWGGDDALALVALTALAAFIRFYRLAIPRTYVFDEVYYAEEGCSYIGGSNDFCNYMNPPAEVHPPLGKWLIGVGIKLFDFEAFGWRFVPVLAGTLTVVLLYLLARKILGRTTGATIAAGLLAFDPLHFVHSRTALLDIFPAMFTVAAFLFVVYDRDRLIRAGPTRDGSGSTWARPWRLAAGLAAGAATATKWSGGLCLIAVLALTFVWELTARKELGVRRALTSFLRYEMPTIVFYLGVVPVIVYVASYATRLEGTVVALPWAEGTWWREWWRYQTNALSFHRGLRANHGYASPPWSWILIKRPISYYFQSGGGDFSSIFGMGNPFVWLPSIAAVIYTFVRWVRRRALQGPEGVILMGFATMYLSWLVIATERAAVFLFYILPAVPFMCLAIAYAITTIRRTVVRRALVGLAVIAGAGWFLLYYPILSNVAIDESRWRAQMFFADCEKPPPTPRTNTVTQAIDRQTTIIKTNVKSSDKDLPPKGWCWI